MDRRSFLIGAGAAVVAVRSAGAQDGSSGLTVLADKVTATEKSVPEGVNRLVTFAYDAAQHPTRGGARYRLSDADETARHPQAAWFSSANGRYFLLDENPASPLMLGAVGDGETDDAASVQATRDFCVAAGRPMLIDAYFAHVGKLVLDQPISIRGIGRGGCGLYLAINREIEGVNILASGVTIEDIEIRTHIPKSIQNGQGSYGTCITIGKVIYEPVRKDGKLVAPELVTATALSRLKLTRAEGSAVGHAIACVGRISGVVGNDLLIEGASPKHPHGDAVLVHWGSSGEDFPLEPDGTTVKPLVMRRDPEAFTYHPNNIRFENLRVRNTGRLTAISAAYAVQIGKVDYDGLDDGVARNGAQLLDLVVGDDGDRYAHPDDQGKVFSNISLTDVIAYNIAGSGINARALIDVSGFGTSKQANDPNTGARYLEQPRWKNIEIANVLMESDLSDTTELINVRNFLGDITFRDVQAIAKVSQGGFSLQQCEGNLRFENCTVNGRTLINDCDGVAMRECRLVGSMLPVLAIKLNSSKGFMLGERVTGGKTGVVGRIAAIPDETTLNVQLIENWAPFVEGEDLVGSVRGRIVSIATQSNATLTVHGETVGASLGADLEAGGTVITVSSKGARPGFPRAVKIGDKISYDGGVLYVARYAPANTANIEVTPAPASMRAGGALALERRSRNLRFENCDVSGSSRAIDMRNCNAVAFEGGRVRDAGQYGMLVGEGAEVSVDGTIFSNNGLRRLLPQDATLPTRDIAVSENALFAGRGIRFEDSGRIVNNVSVNEGALGGSLQNSIFAGQPIKGPLSIPRTLKSGGRFALAENRTAEGVALQGD
ncbi:right-handed parallel beta-helix repeat-containing protein [Mesorhizobium sp. ASY16-5R]|uniref:right-handed parallel beta-helix repeat-containing protein n=1 Tax=Mesorhizobium sp. ASY16-5R TaxID=3445772 RepID=UPI003FA09E99